MSRSIGNDYILWIDCEMTGLNAYIPPPDHDNSKPFLPDRILEIAAVVTDKDLNMLDNGVEYIVKTDKEVLDNMNEWCVHQHGKTGLTAACLTSTTTMQQVDQLVSDYVRGHFTSINNNGHSIETRALLAGNSVHADKLFIKKDLPQLNQLLHYRILDVSTIKELVSRWYPQVSRPDKNKSDHRAMSDIKDSIAELKHYRKHVFVDPAKLID
ncbi:Phosphatidylinositol 3,4,5-trisphosphate-dependent Rac exchanger 2 protein [Microbotryomycetes sp. JL221]|nr:Phosphatidylinositol 3,4,5-trisphosphate-dependent Rac exchanger 2 protein [Microbotryomycetes sp. JL221]